MASINDDQDHEARFPTTADRYRVLAETLPQLVWVARADGALEYYNRRWEDYTGSSVETILARGWERLIAPDDLPAVEAVWTAALKTGQPYEAQFRILAADGGARWFLSRGVPLRDEAGRIAEWFGTCTDIHDQKEAERTQRFLAALSERMRQASPDDVLWQAETMLGEFLQVSRCTFGEIDLERDQITVHRDYCRNAASLAGTYPRAQFGEVVQDLLAGRTVTFTDTQVDPRTQERYAAAYAPLGIRAAINVPVLSDGRQIATFAVQSDTVRAWTMSEIALVETVAERAQLALENARLRRAEREQDRRNAMILDSITDAFFALGHDWRFTYLNVQAERLLLRTREQLLGKNVWDAFPAAVGTAFYHQYRRAVSEQTTVSFEEYYPPPLDTWFEVRAYPSLDGLAVYFQNINDRRRTAEALRRSEERYRTLFETMTQGVVYQNADGVIVSANPAAERMLGLTLDQMQGRTSIDPRWQAVYEDGSHMPGEDHPAMRALTTGQPALKVVQGIYNPAQGETRWLLVNSVPQYVLGNDRPYQVYSVFDDVTERRAAQEEIKRGAVRQRAFLRDVLASVTDGKLRLCDTPEDLPPRLTPAGPPHTLSMQGGLRELRRDAADAAMEAGLPEEKKNDLATAVGEAGMNAIVHVGEGQGQVFADDARAVVQVVISDQGPGITLENLPKATLKRGFTTAGTMGHGMKMMLQTADSVYLLTGTDGTTVVIEQERDAPYH